MPTLKKKQPPSPPGSSVIAIQSFANADIIVREGDRFDADHPLVTANESWFVAEGTPTSEWPSIFTEMPAPPPPVPSAGFNVRIQPNAAALIPRHRQVRSKVSRWLPGKWAPGSHGEKSGVPPPFGTAISVGQIFDVGDPAVRANPAHFEFIARDVELADIERLTAEDQVKA